MKLFLLVVIFSATLQAKAQECKNCGKRTAIAFHRIEWLGIQKPDDPILIKQWEKLDDLWPELSYQFDHYFKDNKCIFIRQVGKGTQNSDVAGGIFHYSVYGIIFQSISDYVLKLWMNQVCSNKIMAETEVRFQLYPTMDVNLVTRRAVSQFAPLIKILEFEEAQRNEKNTPFGGDLEGGGIDVQILDRDIGIGQETGIVLWMRDCDGKMLAGQEISFSKTMGGTVIPRSVRTDAEGKALATFKLSASLKGEAIIKARSEPINAKGCNEVYTGEAIMLAPPSYSVSVHYLKRGARNIKWEGADSIMAITVANESELYFVKANASFYHYASSTGRESSSIQIFPDEYGSKSVLIDINGSSSLQKTPNRRKITVIPLNATHQVAPEETGAMVVSNFLIPPWVAMDFKNDTLYNFEINFDFPDDENGSAAASGALRCTRGDKDASFEIRKIKDPKSPYKTENIIRYIRESGDVTKIGTAEEYEIGFVRILSR